ncbi:metallo-beta-lactamase superfamily protein [Trinickia symbiotica]|uniref:MBL fold metallo-hydrolase n=1 Tax=Trinickia symbiotica TaxID=863227 RepID=A0A2N7WVN2_9BURK|nr:MBL fold metallo-hydrolase [Trinickia symbiotica]PMS33401.1 MBL fold metallo-hydrolase [Trinickia symbiotica]PPK42381.1 metallo-beta-lactamase superfamily protein [Trinickia symbiotica]
MSAEIGFRLLKVGHCSHPECIAQRGGRFAAVPFPALACLLIHPRHGPMLFDTGYSDAFFTATKRFPEHLYRLVTPVSLNPGESLATQLGLHGFTPDDIKHLFVSHLHADHIAGIGDYPRAKIFVMRAEVEAMRRASRIGGLRRGYLRMLLPDRFDMTLTYVDDCPRVVLPDSMRPFRYGFDLLGDGSLTGVPLPGHTAGQLGLLFKTTEARTVFLVADACWSLDALRRDRAPTWIASQLFADKREYLSTFAGLRQVLARQESLMMVPSHCESTWKQLSDETR